MLKRCIFACVLILAVVAGWLLRGIDLPGDNASTSNRPPANKPVVGSTTPISSSIPTAVPGHSTPLVLTSIDADVIKRTAGLWPGRGQPIPDASAEHELPVVDVDFYNWRGELLSGWLALAAPEAPVIILTHGTPGNRMSMVGRAAFLYKHGYNVLLFDFQSYGRSQGAFSTLGMVESEDILAAISFIHSLPDTMNSKIGVLGLSMGATAAVLAASRSRDIVALVAESCPVDATRVTADVPDEEAREADQMLVQEVYGVDITQARPVDYIGKLAGRTSTLFINGNSDTITPLNGMWSLYHAAAEPKQYWIVPGAGHAEAFSVDPTGYIQHVTAFFDSAFATLTQ